MATSTEGKKEEYWMSVPAFGDWDKQKGLPDYSLDFSKIREMRKQNKSDYSRISVGNDDDLLRRSEKGDDHLHRSKAGPAVSLSGAAVTPVMHGQQSPTGSKKRTNYFLCCIRA